MFQGFGDRNQFGMFVTFLKSFVPRDQLQPLWGRAASPRTTQLMSEIPLEQLRSLLL